MPGYLCSRTSPPLFAWLISKQSEEGQGWRSRTCGKIYLIPDKENKKLQATDSNTFKTSATAHTRADGKDNKQLKKYV